MIWTYVCTLIIKEKIILILGKGPTQKLDDTTIAVFNPSL